MPRAHDKDFFYKFMSCDTAITVLKNSSLRWRSPNQFNDPFDHKACFLFPFSTEELAEKLLIEIEQLSFHDDCELSGDLSLKKLIEHLRQVGSDYDPDKLKQILEDSSRDIAQKQTEARGWFNDMILEEFKHSRVLCVSEDNSNVVMWSHYASDHSGVCIKLNCIEEIDNTLLAAKPIDYNNDFPQFPSATEYVNHLSGRQSIKFGKLILETLPYVKHWDWKYEKEWRVCIPYTESDACKGFNDRVEDRTVFGAIYFGCRVDPLKARQLMSIIDRDYPHMEIYQARQNKEEFKLEFDLLR